MGIWQLAGATPCLLGVGGVEDFPLVANRIAATVIVESKTDRSVVRAVNDLRNDVGEVTGVTPTVAHYGEGPKGPNVIIVGVVGQSSLLDQLVATKRVDLSALKGAWESFVIAVVARPLPGIQRALIIAGSDRRGAIYGCYELSELIGVSPWHWWADVPPRHHDALFVQSGARRFGPPSVKYRGIFLNDEDWGLQPWAAKTFEPENRGIGPKTYAKVFELMLRLKANTVWPAMHACTPPFNSFPENKSLADEYGIVMGSSHAEPMLRNNVGEWKEDHKLYNYVTNRAGVRAYWEQRVKANGAFENIYTIGMRGIHDSGMQGASTDAERIRVLEQVFSDQRAMLARYVRPDVTHIPQMFCAYKEVLGLYHGGLVVPDDVTVVSADDNFGYIRNFPTVQERKRSGGFGVYYHISYLGAPLSYLWICTTPPALIWEEMTKAYDHDASKIWIANVGDLKPAEIDTEFFLRLAWDVRQWRSDNINSFLREWAEREFGAHPASEIAAILGDYYQLNYQRKPEHLQWWMPGEPPRLSPLTRGEADARRHAFASLRARVERVQHEIAPERQDAFFELVAYPVIGSALANERFFAGEQYAFTSGANQPNAEQELMRAHTADAALQALTERYNRRIAGGKWRGVLNLEPADRQWPEYRLEAWQPPKSNPPQHQLEDAGTDNVIAVEAEHFSRKFDRHGAGWQVINGLGRTGEGAVAVFPTTMPSVELPNVAADAPRLDYELNFARAGEFTLQVNLIPTRPIETGHGLRFGVAIDDDAPFVVIKDVGDGTPEWSQSVVDATVVATAKLMVRSSGPHVLHVFGCDAGVVVDKIVIDCGGLKPSYLGPDEKRDSR